MKFKDLFKKKENKVTIKLGPNPTLSKELLDSIADKFPEDARPTIVETEGEITYVQENGKTVKFTVPLLNIVPIPSLKIGEINIDDTFNGDNGDSDADNTVKINVPHLNIVPIPSFKIDEIDIDSFNKNRK